MSQQGLLNAKSILFNFRFGIIENKGNAKYIHGKTMFGFFFLKKITKLNNNLCISLKIFPRGRGGLNRKTNVKNFLLYLLFFFFTNFFVMYSILDLLNQIRPLERF